MAKKPLPTTFLPADTPVPIDPLGSIEYDLGKPRSKKRRVADDYDYNDPFFEPFEGELEPVELECSLKNFYVFQGDLPDTAKKIARKYNRPRKEEGPADAQPGKHNALSSSFSALFSSVSPLPFESTSSSSQTPIATPKVTQFDSQLSNGILWLIASPFIVQPPLSDTIRKSSSNKMSSLRKDPAYLDFQASGESQAAKPQLSQSSSASLAALFFARKALASSKITTSLLPALPRAPLPDEIASYSHHLISLISEIHSSITASAADIKNYTPDLTIFLCLKNQAFVRHLAEFYKCYLEYYLGLCGDEKVVESPGRAHTESAQAKPGEATDKKDKGNAKGAEATPAAVATSRATAVVTDLLLSACRSRLKIRQVVLAFILRCASNANFDVQKLKNGEFKEKEEETSREGASDEPAESTKAETEKKPLKRMSKICADGNSEDVTVKSNTAAVMSFIENSKDTLDEEDSGKESRGQQQAMRGTASKEPLLSGSSGSKSEASTSGSLSTSNAEFQSIVISDCTETHFTPAEAEKQREKTTISSFTASADYTVDRKSYVSDNESDSDDTNSQDNFCY